MTANARKINAKSVAKYVLLPGIIPRAKELGSSGFGYLAFLIAQVYMAVRILPPTHPFLQSSNIGKFGIRQVVAAAANNVQFTRSNIDQIIVFGATIVGLVLLVLQFLLFVLMVFSGKAFAQEEAGPFTNIFVTENPETDIAFMMLDYVFGIPGVFGSNAIDPDGPSPFHQGMHALFEFYNLALLLVGVLIFLYYVFVVVIETAQTGVPFGTRFSKIYAPFRLIAAVALLVPLGYGFNTAQYITFFIAKLGSSFATNGWILYNENVANPMGVDNSSLVAQAKVPQIDGLFQFASVYHACRDLYAIYVPDDWAKTGKGTDDSVEIKPYVMVGTQAKELQDVSYEELKKHFGNNDFEIVMGKSIYETKDKQSVIPYCGKLTISLSSSNPAGFKEKPPTSRDSPQIAQGILAIEKFYYYTVFSLLYGTQRDLAVLGERASRAYLPARSSKDGGKQDFCYKSGALKDADSCNKKSPFPPVSNFLDDMDKHAENLQTAVDQAVDQLRSGTDMKLSKEIGKYGWGGAGMWFNKIAEINGAVTTAIYAAPSIKAWPLVMEKVRSQNLEANVEQGRCDTFNPNLSQGRSIDLGVPHEDNISVPLNNLYQYWCEGAPSESAMSKGLSGNAVNDMIGAIFGLNGLFTLYEDTQMDPDTHMSKVHPFAALTAIGKSLVENAIRSMGASLGFSLGSGLVGLISPHFGSAFKTISSMFVSIATLGLTAGFVLYYILPFLPFIYFFFAVSSWVKSIFEAMVGTPLWALAHLRIDGDGFSGQAASGGYFLLLEIMLRPIVTVFGLIGSMAVFGASVAILNKIFYVVVANVVGNIPTDDTGATITIDGHTIPPLGMIDQFFFTLMYAILVYLIGNACFKMIDTIPKGFMRWMGTSVATFNDNTGDPTSNLTTYAALGGSQITGQVFGNINKGAQTASDLVSAIGNAAKTGK